jgi:hypothetical protein
VVRGGSRRGEGRKREFGKPEEYPAMLETMAQPREPPFSDTTSHERMCFMPPRNNCRSNVRMSFSHTSGLTSRGRFSDCVSAAPGVRPLVVTAGRLAIFTSSRTCCVLKLIPPLGIPALGCSGSRLVPFPSENAEMLICSYHCDV